MWSWTEQMDQVLENGLKEGLSASILSERLNEKFGTNFTRNAVLGRVFRRGLSVHIPEKPRKRRLSPLHRKPKINFSQHIETIRDLRDNGFTWEQVGKAIGCTGAYARLKAIEHGIFEPKAMQKFSEKDVQYIIKAWGDSVPVEDIADALGRSYGVIRQKILRLQQDRRVGSRDGSRTRLLRQYGERALAAGATPREALQAMAAAKQDAIVEARRAAREARSLRHQLAIDEMNKNIADGMPRNKAIFLARSQGVPLQELSGVFDITRERIRQICMRHAEDVALEKILNKQGEEA